MSALHKSEFQVALCRLANPYSLNSIIYKIKTPEVSNGRFIVKYNVLFILNGQKPLSLPESAWKPACLPSVLPHVLVEANLFSRGVRQASCRALHSYHWYAPCWRRALSSQALGGWPPPSAVSELVICRNMSFVENSYPLGSASGFLCTTLTNRCWLLRMCSL